MISASGCKFSIIAMKNHEKSTPSSDHVMRTVVFLNDMLSLLSLATHTRDCGACLCPCIVGDRLALPSSIKSTGLIFSCTSDVNYIEDNGYALTQNYLKVNWNDI